MIETVRLGDCELGSSIKVKLLGLEIDDKMKFTSHVDFLLRKASRDINSLYRLRNCLSVNFKLVINQSLLIPISNMQQPCGSFVAKVQMLGWRKSMNEDCAL